MTSRWNHIFIIIIIKQQLIIRPVLCNQVPKQGRIIVFHSLVQPHWWAREIHGAQDWKHWSPARQRKIIELQENKYATFTLTSGWNRTFFFERRTDSFPCRYLNDINKMPCHSTYISWSCSKKTNGARLNGQTTCSSNFWGWHNMQARYRRKTEMHSSVTSGTSYWPGCRWMQWAPASGRVSPPCAPAGRHARRRGWPRAACARREIL